MSNSLIHRQQEVDANFHAFQDFLPTLLKEHEGEYVIMRHKQIEKFCSSMQEAVIHATKAYKDGLFSIQEVTYNTEDLGWFSDVALNSAVRT